MEEFAGLERPRRMHANRASGERIDKRRPHWGIPGPDFLLRATSQNAMIVGQLVHGVIWVIWGSKA